MRTLFCVAGEGLIASAFEPPYIPLLIMEDKEVKLKERLEQEDADRRIGTAALMLAKMHTQTVKAGERRKVIVNLENPIVQHLIKGSDPEGDTRIAHLMRSFMLTQCCHPSDDDIDFSVEIQKFMVGLQAITLGA